MAVAVCGWSLPALADEALMSRADRFVGADGYEMQDVRALNAAIEGGLTPTNPNSALRPSSGLGPFVKAVLALEAMDGMLEHVRYRIRYGVEMVDAPPAADPVPVSFVQVERFNLGPAMRQALVAIHGEENVGPSASFGEGEHVSWRLVMRPLMGNAADIVAAARSDIPDSAAEGMTCLGAPCLSTESVVADAAPWSEMGAIDHPPEAPYETERNGLPTPAAAIDVLAEQASFEPRQSSAAAEPVAEAVIEVNLGQDAALDAAFRNGELMDDSVSAIWQRLAAISGGASAPPQLFGAQAFECRRGPDFADPGAFCP